MTKIPTPQPRYKTSFFAPLLPRGMSVTVSPMTADNFLEQSRIAWNKIMELTDPREALASAPRNAEGQAVPDVTVKNGLVHIHAPVHYTFSLSSVSTRFRLKCFAAYLGQKEWGTWELLDKLITLVSEANKL